MIATYVPYSSDEEDGGKEATKVQPIDKSEGNAKRRRRSLEASRLRLAEIESTKSSNQAEFYGGLIPLIPTFERFLRLACDHMENDKENGNPAKGKGNGKASAAESSKEPAPSTSYAKLQ